jgi:hypothetical protein
MGALNFQTSRKTYTVNDGCQISFDPADINFAKRLFALMDKLEKQENEGIQNPEDVFVVAEEKDRQMRQDIDAVFEEAVCDKIFGSTNVFSPAGGLPLCVNFLLAVIDEIDHAYETEVKPSEKMKAYINKYEQKYGKNLKK